MSGGKGGSQSTEVKIPGYIEDASKANINLAQKIAGMGYVPYYGPDVAAATGQQKAAWQGANDAASAFGMPTAAIDLPKEQQFANGVSGYSSGGLYDQALAELRSRRPGIAARRDAVMNMMRGGGGGAVSPVAPVSGGGGVTPDPRRGPVPSNVTAIIPWNEYGHTYRSGSDR